MLDVITRLFILSLHCFFYSLFLLTPALYASTTDMEMGISGQFFPEESLAVESDYHFNGDVYLAIEHSNAFFDDSLIMNVDGHINYNQQDKNQRLADFSELSLNYFGDNHAFSVGVLTEFWGVTESWHLVDVLNQTNVANNIDEETKRGQPMAKLQLFQEWGTVQLYWMPIFRERIFPSEDGRLRTQLVVDEDLAEYESSAGKYHQDFAVRYSHTIDIIDFGFAYFTGTSRTPLLQPKINNNNQLVLFPYYRQIDQLSLDLQITFESLLLKLEAINSNSKEQTYQAYVTGFEYTQVGIIGTPMDLGYIGEYLYDERDELATTPFADDVFFGLRLVANNIAQSTYLLGTYIDRKTHNGTWRFEMENRIQDGLTLSIEAQYFSEQDSDELLYNFRNDHYFSVGLQKYF